QALQSYAVGTSPNSVAVGDLNGDGHLDLAVANYGDLFRGIPGSVSVLTGNGDGTFQAAQDYGVDNFPGSLAVGDFNGDGFADLALTGRLGVSVLLGNGDRSFQPMQNYAPAGSSVTVGDFNGDGFHDLAVADGDAVAVLLNAAD